MSYVLLYLIPNRQTNGHDVASRADSSKILKITSRSIEQVLSRSPAMHQLTAAFRGVAQHQRQTRTHKVPIIDHILTAVRPVETGLTAEAPNPAKRSETLDMLKNMYEYRERRDDENALREEKLCLPSTSSVDYRV
ncbi:hypothetical protein M378DRAFT_13853 [Amanita muscaria Koide BX008]|uniref:Uncharacterized protein n=1 Tax=Amanita muscaria (strain Koide BX008) TaxID=946122 RepID=A0A0C2SD61_AMAMK|nr:hypothetical protein M378DRAFT_13853 [Amanita muscaria Koide BX008]